MNSAHPVPLAWLAPGWPFLLVLAGLTALALLARVLAVRQLGQERFVRASRAVEHGVLTVLFLGILVASMLQIFMRNIFRTGFLWTEPVARYLVLWIAFFGALTATSRARHLAIDIVTLFLKPGPRARLRRAVSIIAAIICAVMANGAYAYLRQEYEFGRDAILGMRTWAVQCILLFGFMLLTYRFLVTAIYGIDPDEGDAPSMGVEQP